MNRILALVMGLAMSVSGAVFARDKMVTDASDRDKVFVTVYNSDLALVRDVREVEMKKGEVVLEFRDVAKRVIPQTVATRLLGKGSLTVLEQNYEYDLLTPERLVEKFVGGKLSLVRENPKTGEERRTSAVLLSSRDGGVFRTDTGITFGNVGRLEIPTLPDSFVSHPTLRWILKNEKGGKRKIETSYLTEGMNWQADYVLILNEKDTAGNLNGWVTLSNQSGASYVNAALALVAGDVNRIPLLKDRGSVHRLEMESSAPGRGFMEENLFEYHLYTLDRPTTIADHQQKQVALLEASDIRVKRRFRMKSRYMWLTRPLRGSESNKPNVDVFIELMNRKKDGLGMPLPAGVVRVYKSDSAGGRQFLGEDRVEHTPTDEKVEVKVGRAFDVVAERKQLSYRKISDKVHQSRWEIKVRNHKKEKIEIEIEEPMVGDWEVLESSVKASRKDAITCAFVATVRPGAELVLTFKVQTRM